MSSKFALTHLVNDLVKPFLHVFHCRCFERLWLFMMTVVTLSAFLRFKTEFFFNSFKAITSLRDELFFWLSYSNHCKLCFDIFLIALKGNRRLNWWYPVRMNLKRIWFFVLSVKDVFEAHSSCKLFKILQELLPNFTFVCHGCWNEFESFDSMLTCLSKIS